MIINIRGANGSGKSTIVRKVMAKYPSVAPEGRTGRRQPIGYACFGNGTSLYIPGHYETDCGGCDTITELDDVYAIIRRSANDGYHVLYEGIMVSGEYRRCVELSKSFPVVVLGINIGLDECLDAVRARRESRGDTRPFNPDRTIKRYKEVRRNMEHLKINKVSTEWVTRDAALKTCFELLGIPE